MRWNSMLEFYDNNGAVVNELENIFIERMHSNKQEHHFVWIVWFVQSAWLNSTVDGII